MKKYDISGSELEMAYYAAFTTARKFKENYKDLLPKCMHDSFESLGIDENDIDRIIDYFDSQRQEEENAEKEIEEEMQTSGFVNSATTGRRKKGYKVEPFDEYS